MNEQNGQTVAARLARHHLRIHRLWEERVRQVLGRAPQNAGLALSEALTGLLNRLAAGLSNGKPLADRPPREPSRANLAVGQVLQEYQVLRQVLFDVLEEESPIGARDRNRLLDFLDRELLVELGALGRSAGATALNQLLGERDRLQSGLNQLEGEAEYRKRFVATVAHDLRSPLAASKSAAQLIARAPENLERVRLWADRIAEAMGRADSMVANLLDVNRLEAGERITATFALCDVKRVAQDVTEELASRHGGRFRVDAQGITLGFWSGEGLRRVLDNLLANAIKYGAPDTPVVTRIWRTGDRVSISVHNQGSFISDEDRAKLFQPYQRSPSAEASGQSGWGLGLILVRGIVESHHGTVEVESSMEEGTTFIVALPVDARAETRGLQGPQAARDAVAQRH